MRVLWYLCFLSLAFCRAAEERHRGQQSAPTKVTLCELAEHPDWYAGKIVAIHATEMGRDFWIEDFTKKCSSSWADVIVVYPNQIKPRSEFDLVRDEPFNTFFEEVRKGNNVEATYEGRFDVAYVWRDHKRIWVGTDKGYGEKHNHGARIVLRSISEVVSRPRYRK